MNITYIAHGGGPMPLLGDPGHREMVSQLEALADNLPRPSAIVVISAHWEERQPAITAGAQPPLIYDYYGFPEESYTLTYPCPGHPSLARKLADALNHAGIDCHLDDQRGFDHGLFVPLKLMYPDADIPCIQLSLVDSLDPELHLALGEALQGLRGEDILVIGSGFSFHNMQAFFGRGNADADSKNEAFQTWLEDTCTDTGISESERRQRLLKWDQAPYARFCHPREEHLLPLHVCYGMAGRACDESRSLTVLGKDARMFTWRSV
jgi:aromatic ring-opening dioxygenase catalytic subunit (LigB family)